MKTFEVSACFRVFATCFVEAKDKAEAESKIRMGGGYIQDMEFEKHTAEFEDLESIRLHEDDEDIDNPEIGI